MLILVSKFYVPCAADGFLSLGEYCAMLKRIDKNACSTPESKERDEFELLANEDGLVDLKTFVNATTGLKI